MAVDSSKDYFMADLAYYKKPEVISNVTSDFQRLRDIALRRSKWFIVIHIAI